jgi:hypothetical protein
MRGIFDLKAYKKAQSTQTVIDRGQAFTQTDQVEVSERVDDQDLTAISTRAAPMAWASSVRTGAPERGPVGGRLGAALESGMPTGPSDGSVGESRRHRACPFYPNVNDVL